MSYIINSTEVHNSTCWWWLRYLESVEGLDRHGDPSNSTLLTCIWRPSEDCLSVTGSVEVSLEGLMERHSVDDEPARVLRCCFECHLRGWTCSGRLLSEENSRAILKLTWQQYFVCYEFVLLLLFRTPSSVRGRGKGAVQRSDVWLRLANRCGRKGGGGQGEVLS